MALAQLLDALFIPGAPRGPHPTGNRHGAAGGPLLRPKPSSGGCFYLPSATTTSPTPSSPLESHEADPSGSGSARTGAGPGTPGCASPSPASPASAGGAAPTAGPQPPRELPRDALEAVLRRCDADTLVGAVPAVCRAWREAAAAVEVWKERLAAGLQVRGAAAAAWW